MINAKSIYVQIRALIFDALEPEAVNSLDREQLKAQLSSAIDLLVERDGLSVPSVMRDDFVKNLVDELLGLGPLQSLMDDDSISDIMINGHENVFIERAGIVEPASINFIDEEKL